MINPGHLREGMTVRDGQGRRLGTVAHVGDTWFELGQGSPARRDFMVHFHQVARIAGSEVLLAQGHLPLPPEDEQQGA
jgi:hypothetical protein